MAVVSKKVCTSEEADRLSNLPNDIILLILSFLDTKYSVQTSVLSKRWINLWTDVLVLNFDRISFHRFYDFKKFVQKFLDRHDPKSPVDKFRFCYPRCIENYIRKRVINHALSPTVEHLDITLNHRKLYPLSQALSECQRLKTLKLSGFELSANLFGLAKLTTLHLSSCSISFSNDCCDFSEGFPNLNKLCLHYCDLSTFKVLKLSGSQLHSLSVSGLRYENISEGCKVEIFAPKLTFLFYQYSNVTNFGVVNLPSLQHADIEVSLSYESNQLEKDKDNFFRFFQSLYNTQCLALCHFTIEALDIVPGLEHQPSPFSRLKSLRLRHLRPLQYPVPQKVKTYLLKGCSCVVITTIELQTGSDCWG